MWSARLLVSVLLAARSGLSQQLTFTSTNTPQQDISDTHIVPQTNNGNDDISTTAETIVSALTSSSQHTITLHLLQRAKCIPLLAHIGNATLFAPTDQAWTDWANKHHLTSSPAAEPESESSTTWLGDGGLQEWLKSEEEVLDLRISNTVHDAEWERSMMDNQNWALRQHLLYHMLNCTLQPADFIATTTNTNIRTERNITIETTLLYPLAEEPPLPPTPEPGPPWLPRGGEGLLGGHGQRVRLAKIGSEQGGERGKIGLEWNGEDGVTFWDGKGWEDHDPRPQPNKTEVAGIDTNKDKEKEKFKGIRWTRNGAVVGIDGVLDMPPSIEEIIRTHPSLRYLSHLLTFKNLPTPLPDSFATSPHLTLFAPSHEAFNAAFDDIEKGYLAGPYGEEGAARVLAGGVVLDVGKGHVGWSDTLSNKTIEASSGLILGINSSAPGQLLVNGSTAATVDIFASNGVIHIVPNLLIPENFSLLNSAEKMLLSLNATRFVSLLRSANLSDTYIGSSPIDNHRKDSEDGWTILAPTDDVLDIMDKWDGGWGAPIPEIWATAEASHIYSPAEDNTPSLEVETNSIAKKPYKDASPLAALLQYHILPGRLLPADIKDGMLLGTELKTSSLSGGRQRLRVDVSERFQRDRNDWEAIGEGEIRFGGATVLGKPVKIGKSIIYLLSSLLSPPDDVLQTAVSDLQLSTFIAAVYAAELDKFVKRNPATTYFMPRNRAFNQLGLAMHYLLLPEGKDELRKVLKYHSINDIIYSPDVEYGKKVYTTLEGGEIVLDRTKGKNGSITLRSPTKWEGYDSGDSLPANGELRSTKVWHSDALTDTGVIHTIDNVIMPADVKISIAKLIRGSKQSTMGDLMMRAGLGWILEGREPTQKEVSAAELQGRIASIHSEDDNSDKDEGDPNIEDLAMPSYTILVPSDKAFSRLNLTHYLNDKEALLDLLKLHIIPSSSTLRPPSPPSSKDGKGKGSQPVTPPQDGKPISLDDDLVYGTLLSTKSQYGQLAFRATGDNSFIVGIKGARGGGDMSVGNSARIGQSGRASVRWKKNHKDSLDNKDQDEDEEDEDGEQSKRLWKDGMTLGGGVLMIDNVLIPYQPSWFSRWGWLVITLSGIGLVLLIAVVSVGWWWMTRGKEEDEAQYEPLEGEEEE
uniref:FAS1 domain-containing protein n=1 Tax=Kwoniella dejecticola CBS 10117 TaxID=1296121 RepID=A0A1A5ZTN2_9TREE|nr:uncharacterized protein I303_08558 [Kwoniella dejecticola CBS 10117]OBR81173.1 hypothetical protein I303_08558 [Kwoniella dejecticola CBS 10117]